MVSLTPEETRAFAEKLMTSGTGDPGRLTHILTVLKEGRQLYNSDKKYLNKKFLEEIGLEQKIKVDEDLLTEVQKLISSRIGDTGRLEFILEFLKQGKTLYKSDEKYLELKLGHKANYAGIIPIQQDSNQTIEALKSHASWANRKIVNIEAEIVQKMDQLQSTHKQQGTLPKGFKAQTQSLEQIQKELVRKQDNLNRKKTEAEKIRIEQSKLTQIILDRQEFEKQIKLEKEQLQKRIAQERQSVQKQNQLIQQIKSQEAELEQAKHERDSIVLQLQKEQAEIASQAEKERARLAEQTIAAKKIQQEKERLESLKLENQKITEKTKLQEHQLEEQVKQEKAKLVSQEKFSKLFLLMKNFLRLLNKNKLNYPNRLQNKRKNYLQCLHICLKSNPSKNY
jgi:hypothetical protein